MKKRMVADHQSVPNPQKKIQLFHTSGVIKANLLLSAPVLESLLGHGGPHDDGEGQENADAMVRGQGTEGDTGDDEEEEVGDPAELLEDRFGDEIDGRVLGRRDRVAGVTERHCLGAARIVAVDEPAVAAGCRLSILAAAAEEGEERRRRHLCYLVVLEGVEESKKERKTRGREPRRHLFQPCVAGGGRGAFSTIPAEVTENIWDPGIASLKS